MKKLSILLLLVASHFVVRAQVWQAKTLPLAGPQFGLFIDVPTSNVAWMATEGGDFSQCPWIFDTEQNTFCKTADGENWTCGTYPNSGSSILTAISALDDNRAYFSLYDFASGSKIIKTINGGQTWTEENVNFSVWLEFMHAFASDIAVGVGDPDTLGFDIHVTLNAQWIRIDPTNPAKIPANIPGEWPWPFHAVEGNNLWCVTNYGRVLHTGNTGFTWEAWNGPEQTSPDAIACHGNICLLTYSGCDSLTGGNSFRLWRTMDKGLNWENLTPVDNHYTAQQMRYIPGTGVVMAALRGNNAAGPFKTVISYDNGDTWETINEGTPIMEIGFYNNQVGWATEYEVDGASTRMFKYAGPAITGISDHHALGAEVSVSPNPTADIVRVKVQGETPGDFLLTVTDTYGRVIRREMIENQEHIEQLIDLSGVPAGVYWVGLSNEAGRICEKIVKE